MKKILFAAIVGVIGIGLECNVALGAAPVAVQVDVASHSMALWPENGDLDFNDQNIAYNFTHAAIGDVDGDGVPDVAWLTGAPGSTSKVRVRGWDGTIKGRVSEIPAAGSLALGNFGDGAVSSTGQKSASLVDAGTPGGVAAGLVQSYTWTITPDPRLEVTRSATPFGKNYTGGISLAAGDVNGDGVDDLIAVAQTPPPGSNGMPGSRVVAMSPSGASGWANDFTVDTTPPDVTSAISVACGPVLGDGTSQILTLFNDPVTGATELKVDRKSISVIFHNDSGTESKVYVIGGMDPKGKNVIHRDLAARMAVADLDGDGRDEVIVSGNDGTGPVVDILHLADVTADDGSEALNVTSVTPLTFSPAMQALYGSDWSSVEFLPSATSTVFDSSPGPLIAPQDAGTLLLTTAFVPEPTCLMMAPAALLMMRRRRRGA